MESSKRDGGNRKICKTIEPQKELNPSKILKKLTDKINMIICFGQTPYQILNEKHPKRKEKELKKVEKENGCKDSFK